MENSQQERDLEFNIDALTDGNSEAPSLSDLYGIAVFTEGVREASVQITENRENQIVELEKNVFFSKDDSSKEIDAIKEKIFSTSVLTKDQETVTETATDSSVMYTSVSIILFCFIIVITTLYARKKSKERKKQLEAIDDFF